MIRLGGGDGGGDYGVHYLAFWRMSVIAHTGAEAAVAMVFTIWFGGRCQLLLTWGLRQWSLVVCLARQRLPL